MVNLDLCHVEKKKVCRTEYKEVCKPVYRPPTYQTAAYHGKKCDKVPEEKCNYVDDNVCKKVPEKICKKVKDKKCLIIPEETCRDTPRNACKKVPALVPSIKEIRECQTCETYEENVTEVVFDKKCERHEKPKCYTAHKEVKKILIKNDAVRREWTILLFRSTCPLQGLPSN